ncbi:MAG: FtsQ-type POTRA domain-containing protein [Rhodobacteraceae bacterium]|nr:FtsQ-type POTRA domain-containing protein [Paracoccaceae bacterium]
MQPVNVFRRDPAPSRMAYRMQRLWLTPLFRVFLRHILPALIVVLVFAVYFGSAQRRAALVTQFDTLRTEIEHRPEFMVSMMSIEGASPALGDAVRAMLAIKFPQSSFDIDLEATRAKIEALDAVASADLRVVPGGVLQVTIREREAAMVWRTRDGLVLLDPTGHRVAELTDRAARAELPLIAGDGADQAVPEAQAILAAAGPLATRIRGLVRIGDRRWDVMLDRDQTILLPETDPVTAFERVIALDQSQGLLAHDIVAVDMRLPDRPVLRLSADAFAARQKAFGLKPTGAVSK